MHITAQTAEILRTSAASLDELAGRVDMVTVARAHALALPLNTPKAKVEAALDERLRLLIQRVGAAEPELLQRMQRVVMVETLDMALHGLRCCSDIDLADDIERLLAVACSN